MTSNEVKDYEYTAIRMVTGLKSTAVEELIEQGVVSSHREIVPDNILHIIELTKNIPVSSVTSKGLLNIVDRLDECRSTAKGYIQQAENSGVKAISVLDSEYPYLWRNLAGMPRVLFAKGNISLLMDIFTSGSVAIVGSRNPGRYSLYATEEFTKELVKHGVVIVSGLALGIDGKAHMAALQNGGKTIAVTPGGPDYIYPHQHENLYKDLYANGLIISEMPPGHGIIKKYFPTRNRLIAALSDVCLIMEAGKYSGTLHTASFAGNQGKDVFVLPNGIYYENGIGGLMLIRDGAEILIDSDTVLERVKNYVLTRVKEDGANYPELLCRNGEMALVEEDLISKMKMNPDSLNEDEWRVVIKSFIEERPRNFDELSRIIPLDIGQLMSCLTELEMSSEVSMDRDRYVLTIQKS